MITTQQYLEFTRTTAIYPKEQELVYLALGITSEAGEIASKVKKVIRDTDGTVDEPVKASMLAEAGDVLWYLARLCDHFNITLDDLMQQNYDKLSARKARNTVKGSGDNR